jgi:hypothetical protein
MAQYYNPTGTDIAAPNYSVGTRTKIGDSLNKSLNSIRDRELLEYDTKIARERQAAQDARQAIADAQNKQIFDLKMEEANRAKQDRGAVELANKIRMEGPQALAGAVTDTYIAGQNRLPELVGSNIMTAEQRASYLDDLVAGKTGKKAPIALTPEQQAIENTQAAWGEQITAAKPFQETELDVLKRAIGEVTNAGYTIPEGLASTYDTAKAAYLQQEKLDKDKLDTRLAALDKESSELKLDYGKVKDKYLIDTTKKNVKSSDGSSGSKPIAALDAMYKAYGSPDTLGIGDQAKIESKISELQGLGYSDDQMVKAINASRGSYGDKLIGVGEDEFLEKVGNQLKTITPKADVSEIKSSDSAKAIVNRLAEIELTKKKLTDSMLTPEGQRSVVMQASLSPYEQLMARTGGTIEYSKPTVTGTFDENRYLDNMLKTETSGGAAGLTARSSGGKGSYYGIGQMSEDSFNEIKHRMPQGTTFEDYKNDRTGAIQKQAVTEHTRNNIKQLESKNLPVTDFTVWLAHNQGVNGANQILSGKVSDEVIFNVMNNLPKDVLGGNLPRDKDGMLIKSEVMKIGANNLMELDPINKYIKHYYSKFDNAVEGQKEQSIKDLFAKIADKKITKNNAEKDYSRSALQTIVKKYDNARQFASQENVGLDTAKEVIKLINEGKFASAEAVMRNNKLTRADDFEL